MSHPHTPAATSANELDPPEGIALLSGPDVVEDDTEAETYPADVVRKLRDENAKVRLRAKDSETRVDELSRELFALRVTALDKLEDVSDLAYDPELLSPDKLAAAVEELVTARPHYAKRARPSGSAGQGNRGGSASAPTFADLFS
jgi:hypothetical protein